MTGKNKFPDTENYAPLAVYVRDASTNGFQPKPRISLIPVKGMTIKYIRADTATPNDQVAEMMREAYREGFNNADRRMVTIETESNAIDSIRSRYAASNGN